MLFRSRFATKDFGANLAALRRDAVDALGRVPSDRAVGRFADAEALGGRGTYDGDVVPRQFRERLRQLLKPTVVREATVVNGRVCAEDNLERATAVRARRRCD